MYQSSIFIWRPFFAEFSLLSESPMDFLINEEFLNTFRRSLTAGKERAGWVLLRDYKEKKNGRGIQMDAA